MCIKKHVYRERKGEKRETQERNVEEDEKATSVRGFFHWEKLKFDGWLNFCLISGGMIHGVIIGLP